MVIWKYPLREETSVITMPKGAKVLTVETQGNAPCLWALVNPEAPTEPRQFIIVGTGLPFDPKGLQYIGTAHGIMGYMVFHVFEA